MQALKSLLYFVAIFLVTLTGCEVIGGIFKAGFWIGVIVVVLVIVLIIWIINRGRRH